MRIVSSESVGFGAPTIEGTRLEVFNVVMYIARTKNLDKYLEERGFNLADIKVIAEYCSSLRCQNIPKPFERYCSDCILSALHEQKGFRNLDLEKIDKDIYI